MSGLPERVPDDSPGRRAKVRACSRAMLANGAREERIMNIQAAAAANDVAAQLSMAARSNSLFIQAAAPSHRSPALSLAPLAPVRCDRL